MSPEVSERSLEVAIEETLLQGGPDGQTRRRSVVQEAPPPYGEYVPGGYLKRLREEFDRALCLIPRARMGKVIVSLFECIREFM